MSQPKYHELFSSENISGLNVQLKHGSISANGKMSLDQNSLAFTNLNSTEVTTINLNHLILKDSSTILSVTPSGMNVSKGPLQLEGDGIELHSNASGIRFHGTNLINTSTKGYVNKFLKVYLYEGNEYKPYSIPLMKHYDTNP
jgi:hypothetical protein